MVRTFKLLTGIVAGLSIVPSLMAFSVFGPAESYETPTLDYVTRLFYGDTEIGGPKNFGEGSRLNVPIITYGYDSTFLNYFGTEGVAAVDAAMREMNSLPPASAPRLSRFLTQDNQAINYTAQALSLTDIKSVVMSIMLEHMGLNGETHVWDLRSRVGAACGAYEYVVINRNYDPVSYNPTPYVNGVLYGYSILDTCPSGNAVSDAIEHTEDQTSAAQFAFTAVATLNAQQVGGFYLGITRDDMGGLAYLYRPNNYVFESVDSNSIVQGFNSSYNPVNINATNNVATNNFQGLLGGVNKINYVKLNFDSVTGQGFNPITYSYTLPMVTNGNLSTITVQRTIFQPDIIFTAGDLGGPATSATLIYNEYSRGFNFITNQQVTYGPSAVLPQVISAQEIITFNNVTPITLAVDPSFLDTMQSGVYPVLLWGSFNGTTNAPIVFPNSTSIRTLENEITSGTAPTSVTGVYDPVNLFGTNTTTTTSTTGLQ